MGVKQYLYLNGNLNRIKEAKKIGLGNNAISGIFKDHNIDISPEEVELLSNIIPKLTENVVPKKAIKNAAKISTSINVNIDLAFQA